jgi:hypothetical protein
MTSKKFVLLIAACGLVATGFGTKRSRRRSRCFGR